MNTETGRRSLLNILAIGIGLFAGKAITKAIDTFTAKRNKNNSLSIRIHPNAVSRNTKGQK